MTVIGDLPRTVYQVIAVSEAATIGSHPRFLFPVIGTPIGVQEVVGFDGSEVVFHDDSFLVFHDGSNVTFREAFLGESSILSVRFMPRTVYAGETE